MKEVKGGGVLVRELVGVRRLRREGFGWERGPAVLSRGAADDFLWPLMGRAS